MKQKIVKMLLLLVFLMSSMIYCVYGDSSGSIELFNGSTYDLNIEGEQI